MASNTTLNAINVNTNDLLIGNSLKMRPLVSELMTIADDTTSTSTVTVPANAIIKGFSLQITTVSGAGINITDVGLTGFPDHYSGNTNIAHPTNALNATPAYFQALHESDAQRATTGMTALTILLTHGDPNTTTGRVQVNLYGYLME